MYWFEYGQILLEKCKKNGTPYHASFELTPFCNFRCNMCYIRLDPDQASEQGLLLTTSQWLKLAQETKALGTLSLEVTGGEAMTRPDFPILYKAFIDLGFLIVLRTNGYLLDKKMIDFLSDNRPCKISISLYGASDETYKKVCGVSNGFSVVSRNILALRDAGLTPELTATITKDNCGDIDRLEKWASSHGFSLTLCGMLLTPIRGAKRSIEHLKVRAAEEEYILSDEMLSTPHTVSNRSFYENPFWMCRAFGSRFTITWDGRMTLCNSSPSVWKDPFLNGVQWAFHELYKDLTKIRRPKECYECKYIDYCSECPSHIYSATGSFECTNDEICNLARRRYKRSIIRKNNNNIENFETDNTRCEL